LIGDLISSKTRVKLLLKFFLNGSTTSYLRELESEFGESTNAIRLELNKMEDAGMLESYSEGNKKFFKANRKYPLFNEIHSILLKYVGLDQVLENVLTRLGHLDKAYLDGSFAKGRDSGVIDLILVGQLDKSYLIQLVEKAEKLIKRKIRYLIYDNEEELSQSKDSFSDQPLLIYTSANEQLVTNNFKAN